MVERFNGYLATSFLPGRTFAAPGDFQDQLTDWLVIANQRTHRTAPAQPKPWPLSGRRWGRCRRWTR